MMLSRLLAARDRSPRVVLGLNSGTSADGVDAALVEIRAGATPERPEARLLAFRHTPYPEELGARLRGAASAPAADLAELGVLVAEAFAAAGAALAAEAGRAFDLVGSHGQTISHFPRRATLQIGEAAVLAERLGVPVISDFRPRDVAAGGEGAPLVPLVDWILFAPPAGAPARCLQNIGGIANVSVVPAEQERVFAFDTGPGNMPLDGACRRALGIAFDDGGTHARRGQVDDALVAQLLAHPFFAEPPPRSTGREDFGDPWLTPLLARFAGRPADLLATLTRFVAASIHDAYRRWVFPRVTVGDVHVSGGGAHNLALMDELARLFAPIPVETTAALGLHPAAKEAMAFALLADRTLCGLPGNLPAATGAIGPRILGKITP